MVVSLSEKWRGWETESHERRLLFVATAIVVASLAVSAVVGTFEGKGFESVWLWIGFVQVPVLLWLVSRLGSH